MSHTYEQITGRWLHDGSEIGRGYSGRGAGRNTPFDGSFSMPDRADLEALRANGPIPAGRWRIGPAFHHPRLGPVTMPLVPLPGTETFGRDSFRIHGNDAENNASEGCIILPHDVRELIAGSVAGGDNVVEVVERVARGVA